MNPTQTNWTVVDLRQTCYACPSQWEGRLADGREVYVRYRHGVLRMDIDGRTAYRLEHGDGLDGFMTTEEMMRHLSGSLAFGEASSP